MQTTLIRYIWFNFVIWMHFFFVYSLSIFLFTFIINRPFYFDLMMLPSSTVGNRFFFLHFLSLSLYFVCFLFEIAVNTPHNYVDKNSMQNCDCFSASKLYSLRRLCCCLFIFFFFSCARKSVGFNSLSKWSELWKCTIKSVEPFSQFNHFSKWRIAEIQIMTT